MLLAVDIGNSSTKFGVYKNGDLTLKFFIPTKRNSTPSEFAEHIGGRLNAPIDAAIVTSVVPELDSAVSGYVSHFLHIEPTFVRTDDDFGLTFKFPTDKAGTDRLVNSFAAVEKYGVPCIVVSFGTATTIDVVNADREHLGGLIAPGMPATLKALALVASKLPEVELRKPDNIIANTTETAIQSGVIYGHIAMVEGLLRRIVRELDSKPKVIATGGFVDLIAPETDLIDTVDNDLTLDGLRMLYTKRV